MSEKPILFGDLDGTATLALSANHANTADTAINVTNANHADTADNATHAVNADNATNAVNATNADNATHAINADNATNATNAVTAQTATNATNATKAKTANNALTLGGKSLADILASGATKAVKLEENPATGAFRYDLGNGLILVVFNVTLKAGANTPSNCSTQVAEFPNKILFAIPTIVDNTCHSAFVSYDIMGNYTIRMWVASTAEDMSQNRTFKVRCVVVRY